MKPKMYSMKENFVQEWQTRLSFQPVLTGLFVFKTILQKRNLRICCNPSLQSFDYLMIMTVSCCCYISSDLFKSQELGTGESCISHGCNPCLWYCYCLMNTVYVLHIWRSFKSPEFGSGESLCISQNDSFTHSTCVSDPLLQVSYFISLHNLSKPVQCESECAVDLDLDTHKEIAVDVYLDTHEEIGQQRNIQSR
jgi:hypothetical protein